MQGSVDRCGFFAMIAWGVVLGTSGSVCLGQGSRCVDGTSTRVCVTWGRTQPPALNVDFRVTFGDPLNPDVQLITGETWSVYAEDIATGSPANIGSLTLNPALPTDNFEVTVANGTGAGAANMGSMDLTKKNGWNGFSSIAGGTIAGDLTGILELQQDTNGAGGDISGNFVVGQNLSGAIMVPVISGAEVTGSLTGNLTVQQGSGRNHSGAANAS